MNPVRACMFAAGVGFGVIALAPLANAQGSQKFYRSAVLSQGNPSTNEVPGADFLQGLRDRGYVDGRNVEEISAAFSNMAKANARALLVGGGQFLNGRRDQLIGLAALHAIPASYYFSVFVGAGGLMSYGASQTDAYRRAGVYVARILKGEKPGDLPVELPTRFELAINLKAAKALGLGVPSSLLSRADEVIQ